MRSLRNALAALIVSAAFASAPSANAGEPVGEALIGTWKPRSTTANDGSWAILVFGADGRFAMLAARPPESLPPRARTGPDADPPAPVAFSEPQRASTAVVLSVMDTVSGYWSLAEDGGEVVLSFDGWRNDRPAWTRYLQLLLVGDELHPYPGMRGRSPISATSWRRVTDGFGGHLSRRAWQ